MEIDFQSFIDLIKFGSDEEIANKFRIEYLNMNLHGWTSLHYASRYGRVGLVNKLIDNKCDINPSDWGGYQPIHLACQYGHIDIVKILIDNKCDINASNNWNGDQPIHLACQYGHIDIVKILINNKCDINASNKKGESPIDIARQRGYQQIIDIFVANQFGESPIDRQRGHQQIIDSISTADQIESIIASMNLKCLTNCDHKFCSETLKKKKIPKGESIGSGSFGEVYKYKISNTNQEIVIKKAKNIPDDKKYIETNINKFSSQIIHKNIVRYFGVLEKSGKLYIFMEYISQGSLKDLIDKSGKIEINKVIRYSKQILVGLQFLHSKAIIHRDIKPANILLDHDETVKLADFGLSRSLQKSISQSIEQAESFCGTPNYIAPEILLEEPYDYPADIWSTGVTIIHMITGKIPYHNLRPLAVVFKIGTTKKIEFTPNPPISETMQSFIDDLLTPDQSKRPKAEDLLNYPIFGNI